MFWKALVLWFLLFEIFGTEIHDLKKFPNLLEVPERCRKSRQKIQDAPKRKCGKAFLKAYDFDARSKKCHVVTNPNTCLLPHQFITKAECELVCLDVHPSVESNESLGSEE